MSSAIIVFQKEMYKFQTEYLKEIMSKIEDSQLMTPELMEVFNKELDNNVVKEEQKKKKKKKIAEKTPRQIMLSENMKYIKSKYPSVAQTNIMTCGQYMTTRMMNNTNLTKDDALDESIKQVHELSLIHI